MTDTDPYEGIRFSQEFWMLFFDTIHKMTEDGMLDEGEPDTESADLFFVTLATRMIDLAKDPMPPLDDTIAIIKHIMRNEIADIQEALAWLEQGRDN